MWRRPATYKKMINVFMEVARRPTDENIKNWMEYIQKNNDVQRKFMIALNKYRQKNEIAPKSEQILDQKMNELKQIDLGNTKVSVTTYFLTSCPACKKMFKTLDQLQRQGLYVEAIQIDTDKNLKTGVTVPVYKANDEERKGLISAGMGVPYSIIRVGKKAIPLNGYQTVSSIISAIQNQQRRPLK